MRHARAIAAISLGPAIALPTVADACDAPPEVVEEDVIVPEVVVEEDVIVPELDRKELALATALAQCQEDTK